MSILIIQLPGQARMAADSNESVAGASDRQEYVHVLTANGTAVARQGCARAAALPRAEEVVAVMAPTDVSWHRITLPKAAPARLRQALGGLLEEVLLDDPEELHMAVAPDAQPGQPCWVAVCRHTALTGQLVALEKAKVRVTRVVPALWPDAPETAYFHALSDHGHEAGGAPADVVLSWSSPSGVATWPLQGGLARALLPQDWSPAIRCFASPAAAAPAERWLGHAVHAHPPAEFLMRAARSPWNLLQFELAPSSKGMQALSDRWRVFLSPQWRPVRAGLVALALVQVVGLNAWAWHQQRDLRLRKAQIEEVLRQAHPQVKVILDAPVQMKRETDTLRTQAGQLGATDLEALLQAVAVAWPGDAPLKGLAYDGSSLALVPPEGWASGQREQFGQRLTELGHAFTTNGAQLTIRPMAR